jgi:Flp pilus assembly protein TadG
MMFSMRHWRFRKYVGRRGIAAVEFALVAPILLVLFIGTIEVFTLYRTEAKLNTLAFNVAQMVAVEPASVVASGTVQTSLNDICAGAVMGLAPFPSTLLTIDVASVTLEQGPNGLPATNTSTSKAYNSSNMFDEWEADSAVVPGAVTCTTPGTNATAIGATNAESLATTMPPVTGAGTTGTAGQLEVPCDNMIIVKASITYSGLTGLILRGRPILTQTAFSRWNYGSETQQLNCPTCTLTPATPLNYCKSTNTATN